MSIVKARLTGLNGSSMMLDSERDLFKTETCNNLKVVLMSEIIND